MSYIENCYVINRSYGFCEYCGFYQIENLVSYPISQYYIELCTSCYENAEKKNIEKNKLLNKARSIEESYKNGIVKIVTAGVIKNKENKILITKRNDKGPLGGKWEFPGGKLEKNESLIETLFRELKEELSIEVGNFIPFMLVDEDYPTFHIRLFSFLCTLLNGEIILSEHTDYRWISSLEILNYDLAKADLPIATHLTKIRY